MRQQLGTAVRPNEEEGCVENPPREDDTLPPSPLRGLLHLQYLLLGAQQVRVFHQCQRTRRGMFVPTCLIFVLLVLGVVWVAVHSTAEPSDAGHKAQGATRSCAKKSEGVHDTGTVGRAADKSLKKAARSHEPSCHQQPTLSKLRDPPSHHHHQGRTEHKVDVQEGHKSVAAEPVEQAVLEERHVGHLSPPLQLIIAS